MIIINEARSELAFNCSSTGERAHISQRVMRESRVIEERKKREQAARELRKNRFIN